jgi:hypothetical protein
MHHALFAMLAQPHSLIDLALSARLVQPHSVIDLALALVILVIVLGVVEMVTLITDFLIPE